MLECQENQDTNKALIKVLENEKRQSEIALENIVKAVEKGLFTTTTNKRIQELEEKIEAFLKKVDGIKEAKVVITLDSSVQKIYAQNENNLSYILSGNGTPITVTELAPTIRGVGVACTNGDNYEVQNKITMLVSSYLGVPTNKIKIVAIK